MSGEFYVYALKDRRSNPSRVFYVGKGTGSRRFDHLVTPDNTRKSSFIQEMRQDGVEPEVFVLVDSLSEVEALKIEAELISAFGTVDSGGPLLNTVRPAGVRKSSQVAVHVSSGIVEKAQIGLQLIKSSIVELAAVNEEGITNSEAASVLGLRSEHEGSQKDYLSYSIIGLLLRDGTLERNPKKRGKYIKRK